MSDFKNDTKQYTAADISQYLEGKFNFSEMHAIEKAALEDSFLADAIEGMREARETYGSKSTPANLEQLKEQMAVKVTGGKAIPITNRRWWNMAAAACVLVVSTVLVYTTWFRNEQNDTIAVVEQKNNLPETISPSSPENSISKKDSSIGLIKESKEDSKETVEPKKYPVVIKEEEENKSKSEPVAIARQEESTNKPSPVKQAKDIEKSDAPKTNDQNKGINSANEVARGRAVDKDEKAASVKNNSADLEIVNDPEKKLSGKVAGVASNVNVNSFNGKIIDKNNQPIANATVQLANTNNGYLTDQNGFFKFSGTDSLVNVNVMVVGYATQNFQLRNNVSLNQLQLQPIANNNLDEVVVTTNEQKQRRDKTKYKTKFPSVLVQDAEPASGWIEFDKYIEANKEILGDKNSKSGEVVVSFLVNRNTVLNGFKIEQSLGPAQDAEALRLLKEGPAWRLLKGKKTRVLVIIRF